MESRRAALLTICLLSCIANSCCAPMIYAVEDYKDVNNHYVYYYGVECSYSWK